MIGLNRGQNRSMNFLKEERRAIKTKKKKTKFKGVALALTFLGVSSLTPAGVIDFSELLPKAYAEAMNINIDSAEGLKDFAANVNAGTEGYGTANVTLTASIVLSEMTVAADGTVTNAPAESNWTPINNFKGTFDGDGKTISGIYSNSNGLFGYTEGATIKNVTLANSYIYAGGDVGAIVGRANGGEINSCKTESTVFVSGDSNTSGIVGKAENKLNIVSCVNGGYVAHRAGIGHSSNYNGATGGICGTATGVYISGSYNKGIVFSEAIHRITPTQEVLNTFTGGVLGCGRVFKIESSGNKGKVICLGNSVGGVAGNLNTANYGKNSEGNWVYTDVPEICSDIYNTGTVIGRANVGGIFGSYGDLYTVQEGDKGKLKGITNSGTVKGMANVGGILGYLSSGTKIENCVNEGEITGCTATEVDGKKVLKIMDEGKEYEFDTNWWDSNIIGSRIGGIAGFSDNGAYEYRLDGACVSGCTNKGNVSGYTGVGGIFGVTQNTRATVEVRDNENSGRISGYANIGGIMGAIEEYGSLLRCKNSGKVFGKNNIGGIIGSGSCSDSTNTGNIGEDVVEGENKNMEGENVGGIIGSGSCNNSNNNGNVYGKKSVGGIVGSGSCNNSNNKGSVTATGDNAGGIVGSGSCEKCNNDAEGKVVQGANNVGGLIGNGSGKLNLDGCSSTIDVKGSENNIGGLVGYFRGDSLVTGDSLFKGSVTATGSAATNIGGVAGYLEGNFDYNKNIFDSNVAVAAEKATNVGGLVGEMKESSNIGGLGIKTVTGKANVGGLFGKVSGGTHKVILNSSNVEKLNITGNTIVGGLFGNVAGGEISVVDSRLAGEVKVASGGSGSAIGGILGYINGGKATFDKVYSNIEVAGSEATDETTSAGGFIGEVAGGDVFIRNGINMKTVTGKINAAGFIGKIASGTAKLENNINIGAVTVTVTGTTPGGIIGLIDGSPNVTIENTLNNDAYSSFIGGGGEPSSAIHNYQKGENVYTCVNNGGIGECVNDNFNVLAKCVIEMNRCKNSYANSLDNISWVTRSEREKRDKWLEWATTSLNGNEIPTFGVTDNLKFVINWKARNVAMADQVLGLLDGAQDAKEISNLGFGFTLKNNGEIVSPDAYSVKLIEKGNTESEKAYIYFINVVRSLDKPISYTAYIDETQGVVVNGNNRADNIKQGGTY